MENPVIKGVEQVGSRTIIYPKMSTFIIRKSLGLEVPPALVIDRTSKPVRCYAVKAR